MKTKLTLALLLAIIATCAYPQSAEEVVSNYLLKIGGIDKWKALKSRKIASTQTMQGVEFKATDYEKPVAMKRSEIKVQGMEIIMTYNGKEGWTLSPQMGKDPVKLNDEQLKVFTEDEFEDIFIDYKKKGHEIALLGIEEVDGIRCFKIQLIKNKNNDLEDIKELHFFDTETYFPVMRIGQINRAQKIFERKIYFGDYHEVDGLMTPFYVEFRVEGQTMAKITVEKITFNEPMDDSLFTLEKK